MLRVVLFLLALVLAIAGLTFVLERTAPSLIGWLDASLTPDGTRALPFAAGAVIVLAGYFVRLARRDAPPG